MAAPTAIPAALRPLLPRFVIAYAATIVAWACAHDLYLIGAEPRHFTEYHRTLLPVENHVVLAIQYATVATLGPGMVFGALACIVSAAGRRTPLSPRSSWFLLLPFVAAIEIVALAAGAWARMRHGQGLSLPYPAWLYPDDTAGIAYSQSVNLTAYAGAFVFGGLHLAALHWLRVARSGRGAR